MADGSYWSTLGAAFAGRRRSVAPTVEAGVMGTAVWGGYVDDGETDSRLSGLNRYRTAADMLANVSIVAAGLRYFLNLCAAPSWKFEPAKDMADGKASDEAKRVAEFFDTIFNGMDTNWSRVVRRSAMFRFHGFSINEWTAKRLPDGSIGLLDIESRPQHTIERWDIDASGALLGVEQRDPKGSIPLYIPRKKFLYLVDDALSDSPTGMGLFRHLVDPANRMTRYLQLEGVGFDRDLRGIPVGRAPLAEINAAVEAGKLKPAERTRMLEGLRKFLQMAAKSKDTSLMLDSTMFRGTTADGETVSAAPKWALELINSQGSGFDELGKAIERVTRDMALIIGVEQLLMGAGAGASGNRALSEDKSRNLYISVNQCIGDMAASVLRDVVRPIGMLNGIDEALLPTVKPEDASFKDAATVAAVLRDMSTAGAVLAPDDPAIDDVRDLLGVSRQPDEAVQRAIESALMDHESQDLSLQQQDKELKTPTPKPAAPGAKA